MHKKVYWFGFTVKPGKSDMAHYIIAKVTIRDPDTYQQYSDGFMDIFQQYEGKMLAVDESPVVLEGTWPVTRTVLIEFPSAEAAMRWYESASYQELAQHRFAASDADIVLIKGL